ncbi:hypothetical protein GRZ55_21765 [Chelativorans sp. ZYF759]|uniref:STAS/SEC14 domain-containing protein n=1 Tax=Chelativorans sp. ZYF759 TaxID=2692213 RepID=UPI00145F598A|nr:STAS/SEC14 domain-containing protein [Chelativorans sp. ZYF759]NMG41863.1 hypothetical protein [Chelativorans sp. ZYF759]
MNTLNISKVDTTEPRLHAFEIVGKITRADVEWMADVLRAAFEAQDSLDILIVMKRYEGIEAGAIFDRKALSAQARSASQVDKYAVVGAPDWAEAMINFFSPISPVQARTFDLEDEQAAWTWVRSA